MHIFINVCAFKILYYCKIYFRPSSIFGAQGMIYDFYPYIVNLFIILIDFDRIYVLVVYIYNNAFYNTAIIVCLDLFCEKKKSGKYVASINTSKAS